MGIKLYLFVADFLSTLLIKPNNQVESTKKNPRFLTFFLNIQCF